jgi:flagellar biosynthesis protein FlhG
MNHQKTKKNVIPISSILHGKNKNSKPDSLNEESGPMVISIASGKGGVGKTNIIANLGHAFCSMGKKVLIFDADLGLGNLDILLGLTPKYNLSHFIMAEKKLEEILVEGPMGMKIIPASSGIKALAHLSKEDKIQILKKMDELVNQFDVFLIDTAAGISNNVLYFSAIAKDVVVVVSPEPTSLTDAYALIKVLSYHHGVKKVSLIVNMVKTIKEAEDVFGQLKMVTNRFLDVNLSYAGHVFNDEKIQKGVMRQKIVREISPESPSSACFNTLAENMMNSKKEKGKTETSNFIWEKFLNT